MNSYIKFSCTVLFLSMLAATFIAGCSNPVNSEDEHPHPEGAVLKMNGEEIVRYVNGESTGSIEVNNGEETSLVTLYFLDENGNEFQPDEPENTLNWKGIDSSIAEIEQHPEDGKWSFHVRGLSQGNTTVTFQLYHDGHSDFDITGIPVSVK